MALKKLKEFFGEVDTNTFNKLLNNRVIVTEKISSSSFYVNRSGDTFNFYKSSNSDRISKVDRTIVRLYEIGIKHFESLDLDNVDKMPLDWKFGFEYLPDVSISEYNYDETPKNNLILTHIHILNESGKTTKVISDPSILKKWSKTLQVQEPNIIFDGNLTQEQKNRLSDLLSIKTESFSDNFDYDEGTDNLVSFTKEMFKIFDNSSVKSTLHNNLEKEIDGLVVSFVDDNKLKSFKFEGYDRVDKKTRESSDMYQLTIADLLEYMSQFKIDSIELKSEGDSDRYLELMSGIFNEYIRENATKYIGVNFNSAKFSDNDLFKLSPTYILNETTLKYVDNEVLAELFKIMLTSFRKKRNNETDIITKDMLSVMNEVVENINKAVSLELTNEHNVYDFKTHMLNDKITNNVDDNDNTVFTFEEFIK